MKFLSWGPGGFHSFYNLIHKRARIWVTTIVVLAMVAFYVMFQAVSGLSTANYANQRIYNISEAGGLQLRYNNRLLSVFEKIKQILSPDSNQIPATVIPNVGTGNSATGGSGSAGNAGTTADNSNNSNTTTGSGNGTGGSTASVTANNPSIFIQQNQGPSAPKFLTGARLAGVSPDLSWTVQGQVTGGQIGNVVQGKDFVALYHQWVQYNNSGSNPIQMWENSGANVLPRPGHLPGLVFTVNWGDGKSNTGWMLPPVEASLNSSMGIGDNSGATTTIGHGYDLPNTKHIYASAGVYTVTAKACYLSHSPFNDASKNDPNIIIRNPEKFLATGPLDGRCSPESHYSMRVVDKQLCEDTTIDVNGTHFGVCTMAGPALFVKNSQSLLPVPLRVGVKGKNIIYMPSDLGGPEQLEDINVSVINIGNSPATISRLMLSDVSTFTRQSDKQLWVKHNGSVIGTLAWPILPNGGRERYGADWITQFGLEKFATINLSNPLTIAPGQTQNLSVAVQVIQAKWNGLPICEGSGPNDNLLDHQLGIHSVELANQALGLPSDTGPGGGFNAGARGMNDPRNWPPGAGRPFLIQNCQ